MAVSKGPYTSSIGPRGAPAARRMEYQVEPSISVPETPTAGWRFSVRSSPPPASQASTSATAQSSARIGDQPGLAIASRPVETSAQVTMVLTLRG